VTEAAGAFDSSYFVNLWFAAIGLNEIPNLQLVVSMHTIVDAEWRRWQAMHHLSQQYR